MAEKQQDLKKIPEDNTVTGIANSSEPDIIKRTLGSGKLIYIFHNPVHAES